MMNQGYLGPNIQPDPYWAMKTTEGDAWGVQSVCFLSNRWTFKTYRLLFHLPSKTSLFWGYSTLTQSQIPIDGRQKKWEMMGNWRLFWGRILAAETTQQGKTEFLIFEVITWAGCWGSFYRCIPWLRNRKNTRPFNNPSHNLTCFRHSALPYWGGRPWKPSAMSWWWLGAKNMDWRGKWSQTRGLLGTFVAWLWCSRPFPHGRVQ